MLKRADKTFKYQNLILNQRRFAFLIAFFLILFCRNIQAEETSNSEIKASWVYTISGWLDWKERPPNEETIICAIGRDKVYMYLNKIENSFKGKKNRKVIILNKTTNDDLKECKILYISESEQEYYMNILASAKQKGGIITISSINGFAKHGGSIEFVIKKKARLILNMKSFNEAKVMVDEKLSCWVETI